MKKLNKLLMFCVIAIAFAMVFSLSTYATSEVTSIDDIKLTFKYTSDSVVADGLTYRLYTDPISDQSGIELVPNFGIGYTIYDNPETDVLDGIRINGEEVTSLRIPITPETASTEYTIAVRTVYKDDASGDLARILDGTYDYSQLITNPIIIFQTLYWAFMAISGFAGLIILIKNKGNKAKTSDEIAAKVSEKADALEARVVDIVTKAVKSEILPLAEASVKSGKEAVKAILLSNSKSKEAPSALLDVFKESADIDISNIVDEVRDELAKTLAEDAEHRSKTIGVLHNIAHNIIQEDVTNAEESENTPKNQKSLF